MPWDFAFILLFLGVAVPWRGAVRMNRLLAKHAVSSADRLFLYGSTLFFQWLIAGVVAWRSVSRALTWQELGISVPNVSQVAWSAALLTLFLCLTQIAAFRQMSKMPREKRGHIFAIAEKMMPRTAGEIWVYAALSLTAGIAEEFLYRGFAYAVFARTFSPFSSATMSAAILSTVWFALAHLYQGRRGLVTTLIVGFIFVFVRVQTNSLLPSALAHFGVDLVAGLYLSKLVTKD